MRACRMGCRRDVDVTTRGVEGPGTGGSCLVAMMGGVF